MSKRKQHERVEIVEIDDDDDEGIEVTSLIPRRAPPVEVIDIEVSVRDQTPLQARGNVLKVEDFAATQFCAVKVDYDSLATKKRPPDPDRITSREGKTIKIDIERAKKAAFDEEQERASSLPPKEGSGRSTDSGQALLSTLRGHLYTELDLIQLTIEDSQAALLFTIIKCLDTLGKTGSCSGVPVFGYIEEVLVPGRIDELAMYQSDHMSAGLDPEGESTLRVITHKARLEDKRPSDIRVNQDSLHGMLLKTLLDPLLYSAAKLDRLYAPTSPFIKYFRFVQARLDQPFSPAFKLSLHRVDPNHEICPAGIQNLHQLLKTLADKVVWLQTDIMRCPSPVTVSPILELVYHTPGPDKNAPHHSAETSAGSHVTRRDEYQYNASRFEAHTRHVLDYWQGHKKPQGVEPKDARYRCGTCQYEDSCEWRSTMHERSWRVNSKSMRRGAELDSGANKRSKPA